MTEDGALSRRAALAGAGGIAVLAAALRSGNPPGNAEKTLPPESVVAIGGWIADHEDVSAWVSEHGAVRTTSDMRAAFRTDPLVAVAGVTLPLGFCLYCHDRFVEAGRA